MEDGRIVLEGNAADLRQRGHPRIYLGLNLEGVRKSLSEHQALSAPQAMARIIEAPESVSAADERRLALMLECGKSPLSYRGYGRGLRLASNSSLRATLLWLFETVGDQRLHAAEHQRALGPELGGQALDRRRQFGVIDDLVDETAGNQIVGGHEIASKQQIFPHGSDRFFEAAAPNCRRPASRPKFGMRVTSLLDRAAITRSQHSTNSRPPPARANPLTAAMTGRGQVSSRAIMSRTASRNRVAAGASPCVALLT